ncbi:MAG: hypothetical protein ACODAD_01145 [Planctomycetota bacterium]
MRTRNGRGTCIVVVALLTTILGGLWGRGMVLAAPPWKKLIPFKSVDADPKASYWLTEDDGPWLIFATSFAGSGAEQDAHELVLELRERYKLEAYMHKRHFDFTDPVQGRGVNRYGGPKQMRYQNQTSFDEIAVLVGNYSSHGAPDAEETLEIIKTAKPRCLGIPGKTKEKSTQRFTVLRELQRLVNLEPEKHETGPMRRAFVARNPLLPKEFFVGTGIDDFVLRMNQGVKHSLLDCPGKYTVRVASFRGKSQFVGEDDVSNKEQGFLTSVPGLGERSQLEIAADKAHRLTKLLRDRDIEAYEFHDRFESVVTIGSFDSVGNKLPNGRIDLHPKILQIMEKYGPQRSALPGRESYGFKPRKMDGIEFGLQPHPVKVPRRSIGSDYADRN